MDTKQLDPRLKPIFDSRPQHEQFMAMGISELLAGMPARDGREGKTRLDDVLGRVSTVSPDLSEKIDGRPIFHYHGKTAEQLRREGVPDGTIAKLREAYEKRGFDLAGFDGPEPQTHRPGITDGTGATVGGEEPGGPEAQDRPPAPAGGLLGEEHEPGTEGQLPAAQTNEQINQQEGANAGFTEGEAAEPTDAAGQTLYAGKPLGAYEGMDKAALLAANVPPQVTAKILKAQNKAGK